MRAVARDMIDRFYRQAAAHGYPAAVERLEDYTSMLGLMALQPGDRLLDVGCGSGMMVRVATTVCRALGVDYLSPYSAAGRGVCASGEALPLAPCSVSKIVFSRSLLLMNMVSALTEASRVIQPAGYLFVREALPTPQWEGVLGWVIRQLPNPMQVKLPQISADSLNRPVESQINDVIAVLNLPTQQTGWRITGLATLDMTLKYPSWDELFDRFWYYSPLSFLLLDEGMDYALVREMLLRGLRAFYADTLVMERQDLVLAFQNSKDR